MELEKNKKVIIVPHQDPNNPDINTNMVNQSLEEDTIYKEQVSVYDNVGTIQEGYIEHTTDHNGIIKTQLIDHSNVINKPYTYLPNLGTDSNDWTQGIEDLRIEIQNLTPPAEDLYDVSKRLNVLGSTFLEIPQSISTKQQDKTGNNLLFGKTPQADILVAANKLTNQTSGNKYNFIIGDGNAGSFTTANNNFILGKQVLKASPDAQNNFVAGPRNAMNVKRLRNSSLFGKDVFMGDTTDTNLKENSYFENVVALGLSVGARAFTGWNSIFIGNYAGDMSNALNLTRSDLPPVVQSSAPYIQSWKDIGVSTGNNIHNNSNTIQITTKATKLTAQQVPAVSYGSIRLGVNPLTGDANTKDINNITIGNIITGMDRGTNRPNYTYTPKNSIIIGNYLAYQNQDNVLAIHNSKNTITHLEDALIYGDFTAKTLKINGKIINTNNADITYTRNVVAKPDGTFGLEDKKSVVEITIPDSNISPNFSYTNPTSVVTYSGIETISQETEEQEIMRILKEENFRYLSNLNDFTVTNISTDPNLYTLSKEGNYISWVQPLGKPYTANGGAILSTLTLNQDLPRDKDWVLKIEGPFGRCILSDLKMGLATVIDDNYALPDIHVLSCIRNNWGLIASNNTSMSVNNTVTFGGNSIWNDNITLVYANIAGVIYLIAQNNDKTNTTTFKFNTPFPATASKLKFRIAIPFNIDLKPNNITFRYKYWESDGQALNYVDRIKEIINSNSNHQFIHIDPSTQMEKRATPNYENVIQVNKGSFGYKPGPDDNLVRVASIHSKVALPRDKDWVFTLTEDSITAAGYLLNKASFGFTEKPDSNSTGILTPNIANFVNAYNGYTGLGLNSNDAYAGRSFRWVKVGDKIFVQMDSNGKKYNSVVDISRVTSDLVFVASVGSVKTANAVLSSFSSLKYFIKQ